VPTPARQQQSPHAATSFVVEAELDDDEISLSEFGVGENG
jgi:hypothetical protein